MIYSVIIDHEFHEFVMLYILIGLIYLLAVLRAGLSDEEVRTSEIEERVGVVVLVCVLAWPYSFFCWIFSWRIWLMPVSKVISLIFRKQYS